MVENVFAFGVNILLEAFMESSIKKVVRRYGLFTFDLLHNLHLGVPNLVKDCTVATCRPNAFEVERRKRE